MQHTCRGDFVIRQSVDWFKSSCFHVGVLSLPLLGTPAVACGRTNTDSIAAAYDGYGCDYCCNARASNVIGRGAGSGSVGIAGMGAAHVLAGATAAGVVASASAGSSEAGVATTWGADEIRPDATAELEGAGVS